METNCVSEMTPANKQTVFLASSIFVIIGLLPFVAKDVRAGEPTEEKQYEYKEDLKRLVAVKKEEGAYLGHLDARGNFVPLPGEKPRDNLFGPIILINSRRDANESVYEFRSGTLIKGKFDDRLNFIPDIGSTIISFKDYRYSKDAIRIYNLPGTFVEKTDKKPKP
jgi:hypothetical protein